MTRLHDIDTVYRTTPYTVVMDDRFFGDNSIQDTIYANSTGANPIIDVQSNFIPNFNPWKSAIVENMIIDGQNQAGVIGIRLKDVYNCWVRNVTIQNCDVGILLDTSTGISSTNGHRLEHIRMINVRQGIQFAGADNNTNHAFGTINDVAIDLKDDSSAVGIQLGNITAQKVASLSNYFIKASVFQTNLDQNCTGMYIYGKVNYSLINLTVENINGTGGTGIQVRTPGDNNIKNNQSFTMNARNQTTAIYVSPTQDTTEIITLS